MDEHDRLAERFQENRAELRAVAYRMLGSFSEADDAVQEAWLRLTGADARSAGNLGGWLTAGVATVCLDMLRTRAAGPRVAPRRPGPSQPRATSSGLIRNQRRSWLTRSG
jgi:DNA-directed RNA polymerase specialized sigma24 family protein